LKRIRKYLIHGERQWNMKFIMIIVKKSKDEIEIKEETLELLKEIK
jgi:hypothetical protein